MGRGQRDDAQLASELAAMKQSVDTLTSKISGLGDKVEHRNRTDADLDQENAVRRCSFCATPRSKVHHLIAGPSGVCICDECIRLCVEILLEQKPGQDIELPIDFRDDH